MAPSRAGNAVTAGSAPWIVQERRRAMDTVMSEAQDFSFSVCRELEWLNEHMGGIFKPNLDINATFKTPARMRGKTPRTLRKQPASASRAPLSDIFAPNLRQSPARGINTKPAFTLPIAENNENNDPSPTSPVKANTIAAITKPINTARHIYKDSGYHGTSDDEMEVNSTQDTQPLSTIKDISEPQQSKVQGDVIESTASTDNTLRISHDSFVSAKENLTSRMASVEPSKEVEQTQLSKTVLTSLVETKSPNRHAHYDEHQGAIEENDDRMELDEIHSPSDGPSPVRAMPRKSSLTFSSIPAREPLGKTSFGPRASHAELSKSFGPNMNHLGLTSSIRLTAAPVSSSFPTTDTSVTAMGEPNAAQDADSENSETMKLHNKTSTQRLHDRINMLGQSREVRPSKSFHTSNDKQLYPSLLPTDHETISARPEQTLIAPLQSHTTAIADDDDEWIVPISKSDTTRDHDIHAISVLLQTSSAPAVEDVANRLAGLSSPKPRQISPKRPFMHQKMASTTLLASPTKAAMAPLTHKPISVSNPPDLTTQKSSTTPPNSPPRSPSGRKMLDGPISASKAKLNSLLKSAKGIFASSAGASAQAKMESLSSTRTLHDAGHILSQGSIHIAQKEKVGLVEKHEGRRTRSSTERDLKRKADEQSKASDELEKLREKERQKVAAAAAAKMNRVPPPKTTKSKVDASVRSETHDVNDDVFHDATDDMPPPPPPKSMLPTTHARMNQQVRRVPVPRPIQEASSKSKPAPVIIRMPSQRLGQPLQAGGSSQASSALNNSTHEAAAPPPPPKPTASNKTPGLMTHLNSSTSSLKSSNPSAKRALEVAAKKKEQEAKIAQQKAEKKRDLEQKRAQRIEEERKRDEQRKAAEQQRLQEARKLAQRQAEAKRMEMQRRDPPRPESRQNGMVATATAARGDVGQTRPVSKMNVVHDPTRSAIQVNPAKAPKRALPAESESRVPERPVPQRNPPSYQQLDAKRRKTDDQEVIENRGSVMGPPLRQSTMKKEPTKYTHGYTSTHTTPHQSQSMLIKTVTSQHHQQQKSLHQSEMTKYASGRIPFAEASSQQVTQVAQASQYTAQYKTPARPNPAATLSPYYTPGENIELPDIPSDSEDEDSDNEFIAPSWTDSPALREALRSQQLVDPESIFGPIGALNMEEVFRENKDRLKKFRKRTSSANWNGIDRLTDSERKRDRDARERMEADGGWDFQSQRAAMYRKSPKPL